MSMMDRKIIFFLMTYISVADFSEFCYFMYGCARYYGDCSKSGDLWRCFCKKGYTGDGRTCTDIKECTAGSHNCDRTGGICSNTQGSYTCSCKSGYTGNGWTCYDINECTGRRKCDKTNGICTNTPGSYRCSCKTGYTGNGVTCTDINECAHGTHNCDKTGGICTNTPGSFTCTCKPGFYGDGRTCTKDIDECTSTVLKHDCDVNAKCTNTMGSYKCECNRVYFGDGKTCKRSYSNAKITINFKADFSVAYKNTTSALYIDLKSKIEIQLTDRFIRRFGNNKCRVDLLSLKPGSTVADILLSFNFFPQSYPAAFLKQVDDWVKGLPEGTHCTIKGIGDTVCAVKPSASDFDECDELNVCTKPETFCYNTIGGYSCLCNAGFVGDDPENKGCTELDECEELSVCDKPETICTNTVGGYACTCKAGFVGDDPENKGCKDSSLPVIFGVTVPVIIVTVIVVVVVILLHRRKQACFAAKQQNEHDGTDLGAARTNMTNVNSGEDNAVYEAPMAVITSASNEGYEDLRVKTGVRNSNVYETYYEEFSYNSNDRAACEVPMAPSAKQQKEHDGTDLGAIKINVRSGEDNVVYEAPMTVIVSNSNEGYEDLRVNSDVGNSNDYGTYEEFRSDSNDCAGGEVHVTPFPGESNYENVSYKIDESPDTGLYTNVQGITCVNT